MPDTPSQTVEPAVAPTAEATADPAPPRARPGLTTVVFDLGGVVLQWEPRRPYEQVLPPDEVAAFMDRIDFPAWNRAFDSGLSYAVGEEQLIERFPGSATAVRAYREHFAHSLTGMVPGTSAVVAELQQAGVRLLGLTNWSAETFPHARERFGLLRRFESILVSGAEGLAKPDPAIFRLLLNRHGLEPAGCVFVDDSPANVSAAAALGITALLFRDADRLRTDLAGLGLLGERPVPDRPLLHLTERDVWAAARRAGEYAWSSRDLGYEQQGYVHCSFADQVEGVRSRIYPDAAADDLVLLELDPEALVRLGVPVVVEDLAAGQAYPHLYAPLPLAAVRQEHDLT